MRRTMSKRDADGNLKIDRLSQMPDGILEMILGKLSLKEQLKAEMISKRFQGLPATKDAKWDMYVQRQDQFVQGDLMADALNRLKYVVESSPAVTADLNAHMRPLSDALDTFAYQGTMTAYAEAMTSNLKAISDGFAEVERADRMATILDKMGFRGFVDKGDAVKDIPRFIDEVGSKLGTLEPYRIASKMSDAPFEWWAVKNNVNPLNLTEVYGAVQKLVPSLQPDSKRVFDVANSVVTHIPKLFQRPTQGDPTVPWDPERHALDRTYNEWMPAPPGRLSTLPTSAQPYLPPARPGSGVPIRRT